MISLELSSDLGSINFQTEVNKLLPNLVANVESTLM